MGDRNERDACPRCGNDPAEAAYWAFDADRKREGRPMAERDAFKKHYRAEPDVCDCRAAGLVP